MLLTSIAISGAISAAAAAASAQASAGLMDWMAFGDAVSEQAHGLQAERSEIVRGGLDEPARRLLPTDDKSWRGGTAVFTLEVDPEKQNYFTTRFWGDDVTPNYLILHCEGKQIGYRHLGDLDVLDFGSKEPAYTGRFFYRTTPLPLDLTRGKTRVSFEIRSTGGINGYAPTFEQYQKAMTEPSRGIYRVYTHLDGRFAPPTGEKQGTPPVNAPVRSSPGPEVLDRLKERVNNEINGILADRRPPGQLQMQLLGRAYNVKWTTAYKNDAVLDKLVAGGDALHEAFVKDPKIAETGPGVYNPEWLGLGPAGEGVHWAAEALRPRMSQPVAGGATRREAWATMFAASRDWHRRHRRQYTNQSMINDLYGIYYSNRGAAAADPAQAMPEDQARRYLHESIGIVPWLDSDRGAGTDVETARASLSVGENYYQLTAKGLTKELGYVGNYGEVLDWIAHIYNATRPAFDQPGDEKIKAQLIKAEHARAPFRYPMVDSEGNRAMRMENVVGWRDMSYPGEVVYAERSAWEGSAIYSVAATLDPRSVGAVQQMMEDNQFFDSVARLTNDKGIRVTNTLLRIPDDCEAVKAQPKSAHRLPMTPGQPDSAFTDEEDGVVAIKHGDEVLYVSLYWRARYAINDLARVHHITPNFDRVAVVRQQTQFTPSGMTYTRPNWTNFGFGNGGMKYPDESQSAHAGEKLPIAKVPEGIRFRPGNENVHAGKGDFYTLRYGDYLIGMNCSADKTFDLAIPDGVKEAPDLVSGKTMALATPPRVAPRTTVVLYLGRK
jgi:hypothetical protein